MSMQRRLALAFLCIMALFAANQVVYLVGNNKRAEVAEFRRRAQQRRIQILSIEQDIGNLKRQIELQSQGVSGGAQSGFRQSDIDDFGQGIGKVSQEIGALKELTDPTALPEIVGLEKSFQELGSSWLIFYQYAGTNQTRAIMELVSNAEPLSEKLLQRLPVLKEEERQRSEEAGRRSRDVDRLTTRITSSIFLLSAFLASIIAYGGMSSREYANSAAKAVRMSNTG